MTIVRTIILLFTLSLTSTITTVTSQDFNITEILSEFPEYTAFNTYLTRTKLNDEINNRKTITVLVLNNTLVERFFGNQPLSVVKTALSIHVLLDFFDIPKLLDIGGGSLSTTTLYQTTGNAQGSTGFVNITDLAGNKVGFGSVQGEKLDSFYLKTVKSMPYNISVLEITSPIIAPGVLMSTGKALPEVNVTRVIDQAGCKVFASLVSQTGVWKLYKEVETKGLTVFAPTDVAFNKSGLPDIHELTNTELISLLMYHGIPSYVPKVSLKYEADPVSTLASNEIDKFYMSIRTDGDAATLSTGTDDSRVESMAYDSVPICVYKINSVLLPTNLFNKSPSSAPGPVSVTAPALAPKTSTIPPKSSAPAPKTSTLSPKASTPAPKASTPAPKASTPAPKASTLAPKQSTPAPKTSTHAPKTSSPVKPAPEPKSAPAPRTTAKAPSPVATTSPPVVTTSPMVSPPAPVDPSTLSPDGGPAPTDGPAADTGDTKANEACGGVKASMMFLALVLVVSGFNIA